MVSAVFPRSFLVAGVKRQPLMNMLVLTGKRRGHSWGRGGRGSHWAQEYDSIWINGQGVPWWRGRYESTCQCRGHRFNPQSKRIPRAGEQTSPSITTTEPVPRPVLCSERSHRCEEPVRTLPLESSSCSPQQRRPARSSEDPAQPKCKK